jgi:hypothetical protein
MEGGERKAHRRELPSRLLIAAVICLVLVESAPSNTVWAADSQGQWASTGASATASGGSITIEAGHETYWSPPAGTPWSEAAQSDPPPGPPNPNQPYGCHYVVTGPSALDTLGPGGPTPGEWVDPVCAGPGTIDPMPVIWVTTGPNQPAKPAVNPVVLAQQAVSHLPLPAPSIEMAPPSDRDQMVNVSSWLWVDPAAWRSLSATAAAGPVSATATAAPAEVVWQMGDGQSVTCDGPGVPYDSSNPNATTYCSYMWPSSSAGQPGGVYQVTATVYYRASWTAAGAPGGGGLGLVAGPASMVAVRVAESQAINNDPSS